MSTLLCLGLGYCARHYVAELGSRFARIVGTSRKPRPARGVEMLPFDGATPSSALREAAGAASHVLVSAAPDRNGDPVLRTLGPDLSESRHLRSIVYLSSLGVYGDHGGAWIDETAATVPAHERGGSRLATEQDWQALGAGRDVPVAVLRLAGIYGPGQNVFVRLREGRAHRVDKPGHVFNRIHVADIARAIEAAVAQRAGGVFNVCDDEPAAVSDPILFAATLSGIEPPPLLSWQEAQATLSPMALSFYATCNRVRNDRLKNELGVSLRHPTYREGLRALFDEGFEARDPLAA
jgi:nucleoside-diphosphate-sugar epimerase